METIKELIIYLDNLLSKAGYKPALLQYQAQEPLQPYYHLFRYEFTNGVILTYVGYASALDFSITDIDVDNIPVDKMHEIRAVVNAIAAVREAKKYSLTQGYTAINNN